MIIDDMARDQREAAEQTLALSSLESSGAIVDSFLKITMAALMHYVRIYEVWILASENRDINIYKKYIEYYNTALEEYNSFCKNRGFNDRILKSAYPLENIGK